MIRKRYAVMKKKKRKFEMSLKTKANIVGTCAIVFELLAIAVAVLSVIFYLPGGALATLFFDGNLLYVQGCVSRFQNVGN